MNELWRRNIIRTLFVLFLQLILLKRVNLTLGDFNYVHLTIYAVIIALAPLKMPRALLIGLSFILGLTVDLFYDSLGVHAGAATFVAFIRHYVLILLMPAEGYKQAVLSPYWYGFSRFIMYMSLLLVIHLSILYSLEAFSFVYFKEIILRTISSFMASLFLIMIGMLIFNPKY